MNLPRLAGIAALIATVAAPMGPSVVVAARNAAAVVGPTTVVSLTFDDGQSSRGTRVVTATAADGAGGAGIRRVVFKDGATTIRTDSAAPYRFDWPTSANATPGVHRLTAVATDAAGNVTTSAPVTITVTAS